MMPLGVFVSVFIEDFLSWFQIDLITQLKNINLQFTFQTVMSLKADD